jgi:hypothetical protein
VQMYEDAENPARCSAVEVHTMNCYTAEVSAVRSKKADPGWVVAPEPRRVFTATEQEDCDDDPR